jgi:AraC-like DNA-binding protein
MMTSKGELVTHKGELAATPAIPSAASFPSLAPLPGLPGACDAGIASGCHAGEPGLLPAGCCRELLNKGISIRHYPHGAAAGLSITGLPQAFIHLHLSLAGGQPYKLLHNQLPLAAFQAQQHNLFLLPGQGVAVAAQPETKMEILTVNLRPDYFFRCLPETHPLFIYFQESAKGNKAALLSEKSLPITPRMTNLIYDMLQCGVNGHCQGLFMEAKIIELLALQFDQWEQAGQPLESGALKPEELEKMQQVKRLAVASLGKALTLRELAQQVGTNEYDLKQHFKKAFGLTVFGYRHKFKMEKAKEMLLQQDVKIAAIARALGYQHATHFTSAFKKFYGFLPHQVKS